MSWSLSSVPSVIRAETILAKLLGRCDESRRKADVTGEAVARS